MPVPFAGERGSVTVEFAIVAPAVLLLVGAAAAAVSVAAEAIRLADSAGIAARALGRNDSGGAAEAVRRLTPRAAMSIEHTNLVCVRLDETVSVGPLTDLVPLSARGCAAEAGG